MTDIHISRLSVNGTTNLHKLQTSVGSTDNTTLGHAYHLMYRRSGIGVLALVEDDEYEVECHVERRRYSRVDRGFGTWMSVAVPNIVLIQERDTRIGMLVNWPPEDNLKAHSKMAISSSM